MWFIILVTEFLKHIFLAPHPEWVHCPLHPKGINTSPSQMINDQVSGNLASMPHPSPMCLCPSTNVLRTPSHDIFPLGKLHVHCSIEKLFVLLPVITYNFPTLFLHISHIIECEVNRSFWNSSHLYLCSHCHSSSFSPTPLGEGFGFEVG